MDVARMVALALDRAFDTLRTCVVIEGFDVPQVHIRLYPVTSGHLDLSHGPAATVEELKSVGDKIRPFHNFN
jgi:hypothetical protein